MGNSKENQYAAPEQNLGYLYQSHFALYRLFLLPENTAVVFEKEDDVVFSSEGKFSLGSLKHKKEGDSLTNLDVDFWKSVNIWLSSYEQDGRVLSKSIYFLFTTAVVSQGTFYYIFANKDEIDLSVVKEIDKILKSSNSQIIGPVRKRFNLLTAEEKIDFLSRIHISDGSPRIEDLKSKIIDKNFRGVNRKFRDDVYERLLGWWDLQVLDLLTGKRTEPIEGAETSDKLFSISREYDIDNLPITHLDEEPPLDLFAQYEKMLFVKQLKEIDILPNSIKIAILDYYRAVEQRSLWARRDLLIDGEIEAYEKRLINEWERVKNLYLCEMDEHASETELKKVGREIFKWAELNADFRIRDKVTEPYVRRGHFHLLANELKVYWHPQFLNRIKQILEG